MFEFLKTLLIILWIYYAIKLLMRWLFPRILPWMMKQIFKKAIGSNQSFGPQGSSVFESFSKPESGAKTNKRSTPKSKKVVGEYIDFEEIDE
ncbi:MAG: DUF4834 domain-containing protein [Flavobacteriaceae bacterium]|jgi:hypothetical protein|nr:DUF4834 domain-containing protein [Flavobacteriaceae bacterium]